MFPKIFNCRPYTRSYSDDASSTCQVAAMICLISFDQAGPPLSRLETHVLPANEAQASKDGGSVP